MEQFHNYLENRRKERGLSIRALSQGLCSPSTYHAIESGESIPGPGLLKLLVERLGVSMNNFELIIDKNSFKTELLHSKISALIETGNTAEAENLLSGINPKKLSNSVERMFYYRNIAWMKYVDADYESSKVAIEASINETISLDIKNFQDIKAISSTEIENILFLLNLNIVNSLSEKRSVFLSDFALNMIKDYLKHANLDSEEYAVIYPKLWYVESQMAILEDDEKKAVSLSIKAIRVLRKAEIFYMIPAFLNIIATYGKSFLLSDHYAKYDEFNIELKELIDRVPLSIKNCNHIFSRFAKTIYHLDYEVVRGERIKAGFTQSRFIESAYAEESSLSRIENGSHSIRTSRFDSIMKKCDLNKSRINLIPLYNEFVPAEKNNMSVVFSPIMAVIGSRTLFYDEFLFVADLCRSLIGEKHTDEAIKIISDALSGYEQSDLPLPFHFVPYESLRTIMAEITQNSGVAFDNIKNALMTGSLSCVKDNHRIISASIPFDTTDISVQI